MTPEKTKKWFSRREGGWVRKEQGFLPKADDVDLFSSSDVRDKGNTLKAPLLLVVEGGSTGRRLVDICSK